MVIRMVRYKENGKDFKRYKHQLTHWEKDYPHWALETFIKYGLEKDCIVAKDKKGYAVFTEGRAYNEF